MQQIFLYLWCQTVSPVETKSSTFLNWDWIMKCNHTVQFHFPLIFRWYISHNLIYHFASSVITRRVSCVLLDRDTICRICQQTPKLWAFSFYALLLRLVLTTGILSVLYNPASCCSSINSQKLTMEASESYWYLSFFSIGSVEIGIYLLRFRMQV